MSTKRPNVGAMFRTPAATRGTQNLDFLKSLLHYNLKFFSLILTENDESSSQNESKRLQLDDV